MLISIISRAITTSKTNFMALKYAVIAVMMTRTAMITMKMNHHPAVKVAVELVKNTMKITMINMNCIINVKV